jgi:hypothetical protein
VKRDIEISGFIDVECEVFRANDFFVEHVSRGGKREQNEEYIHAVWFRAAGMTSGRQRTDEAGRHVEKNALAAYQVLWDAIDAPAASQDTWFMLVILTERTLKKVTQIAYLLCVEEITTGKSDLKCFRRVGLAFAHDMPEWRKKGTRITAKLY